MFWGYLEKLIQSGQNSAAPRMYKKPVNKEIPGKLPLTGARRFGPPSTNHQLYDCPLIVP